MKKLNYILHTILLTLIISGCSKEESSLKVETSFLAYNKETIQNAPQDTKIAYQNYHLLKIAEWVAKNYKKQVISNAIKSKKNDDSNVTSKISVNDLVSSFKSRNNTMIQKANLVEIKESLEAFSSVKNGSWYPVISMPITPTVAFRGLDETEPVFVIDKPETNTVTIGIDGYQLKPNGDFEKVDEQITPTIASRMSTFVIKLASGNGDDDGGGGGPSGGGGGPSGGFNDNIPFIGTLGSGPSYSSPFGLKIKWLQISQNKEDWWNGASEINIVCFVDNALPQYSGVCGNYITASSNCYVADGKEIRSASRCDIDNSVNSLCDAVLNNSYNYTGTVIYYVIFEYDAPDWVGNHEQTENFTFPNGQYRNVKYRSYQSPYHTGMISVNGGTSFPQADGFHADVPGIKYNIGYN